jgi:hypothetical protein
MSTRQVELISQKPRYIAYLTASLVFARFSRLKGKARSLSKYAAKAKISMAPAGKEDEQNARRCSLSYIEDVLRNLTQSGGCQRNLQPAGTSTGSSGDDMWKLIKWLILIAIVGALVLWFTDIKVRGKTLKERTEEFKKTQLYQEGIQDIRAIVGEALKALGEEVSGEVTDDERKELENVIKSNMDQGGTTSGAPEGKTIPGGAKTWKQQTLKPQPKKVEPSGTSPAR